MGLILAVYLVVIAAFGAAAKDGAINDDTHAETVRFEKNARESVKEEPHFVAVYDEKK